MSAYLSIADAAEYLGLSTKTIRRLIAKGHLPASKVRGTVSVRVRRADLDRLCVSVQEA